MYPSTVQKRLDRISELHRLVDQRDQIVLGDETKVLSTVSEIRRLQSELFQFSSATVDRDGTVYLNDEIAESLISLRAKIADATGEPKERSPEVKFPGNKELADQYYALATKHAQTIGMAETLRRHISFSSVDLKKVLPRAHKLSKYKIPGVSEYTLLVLKTLLVKGPAAAEEVYMRRPVTIKSTSDSLGAKQEYQEKAKRIHLVRNDLKIREKGE